MSTGVLFKRAMLSIVALLVLGLIGGVGYFGFYYQKANSALSHIPRENLLPVNDTPPSDSNSGKPLTYLLLGTDSRNPEDQGRSDTIMMVQIPADRKSVYLLSFPRDIYVPIPGHEANKINAAYEYGGAPLTVDTIQNLLSTKIDHVALVDFKSFMGLVGTLGGVTIDNPYGACDTSQHVCWKAGEQTLTKEQALKYVRWRHGLPNGDITRTENQQRVIKAIVKKLMSQGSLTNLGTLTGVMESMSSFITVDSTLSNDEIKATALNMKISSGDDIKELTMPIKSYRTDPKLGSLDILNANKLEELKVALANDDLSSYYAKHHDDPPAGDATVPDTARSTSPKPQQIGPKS